MNIITTAKSRNAVSGVTGYLYRESDVFYQWLEGPTEAVEEIFSSIERDSRHNLVKVLHFSGENERYFPEWSMGYANEERISLFDWAIEQEISLVMISSSDLLSFLQLCRNIAPVTT